MADIEKDCREFHARTGMLPPGKSEAVAAIGQINFDRDEVRLMLWRLYSRLKAENAIVQIGLDESVKLQSHYAELLNMHDGGQRICFKSANDWLERLEQLRCEKEGE